MRIGTGYDVHRLVEDRALILGGVVIPYEKGLLGHSDADVLAHAISDALLGSMALGDIGKHFPDTDDKYKGISSIELLKHVGRLLEDNMYVIENIDDVSNSVTNLNAYVDGAFKDGILSETEKRAIREQLKVLSAEKADIDNEVTTVINNADLTGTPKTNLANAYNDYVSKYNSLVTSINNILNATLVTPTLKDSYNTAYNNHNRALATLKQRHMEAINAIAETKKQSSITTNDNITTTY